MIKFFHHLFNPHCPDCKLERIEKQVCPSCDVLKLEIERLRQQNDSLLDKLVEPKVIKVIEPSTENLVPIQPRHIPMSVRREQLEAEDRRKAEQLRRDAPRPDKFIDKEKELKELNELEKELRNAEHERETKAS